ncbi:MAG: hypothetical protein HOQ28_09200 [Thermoleophilia bacterium]|nr:hypothetical protein [Thermoleophilia bacterium]
MIVYLRLAFGTIVVLLPGLAVARALGRRSVSAVVAWALASAFVAWAVVFVVHSNIKLAVLVLAAITIGALIVGRRRRREHDELRAPGWVIAFGVVLGWFLWHVAAVIVGDGLFHEARVRKLLALGDLHLRTVDEFKDGGLHPGYAFPLWHGVLALIGWFSGVDAGLVVKYAPALLAPIACAVTWEAAVAIFRSRAAGVAFLAATLAVFCFGAGHGGAFAVLSLPATATRQMLVPAALAIFFTAHTRAGRATLAAIFGAVALTHPTYALFLLIPLLVVLRWEWRSWLVAAVPTGLVLLWLKPIVDETISHNPRAGELRRGLVQYQDQLVIDGPHHFRVAPEVFGRTGAVGVASLILLPLVALAIPRRWSIFALGGSLLVLLLGSVPWLFVHFSDAVGLSQSRRAMGFAPLPFVFVGALALAARRVWVVPLALVAGIVLQRLWPGDFDYGLRHGGPAAATWIGLVGGAAALALAYALRRRPLPERWGLGAAAAVAFTLPVFVHALWHWSPAQKEDRFGLSQRLVHNLRTKVPKGAIVLAPIVTSYRVAAVAPVYIVAAPVTHVAATNANRPYERARDVHHWVLTKDPRVAKRYGATWQIRAGRLSRIN